MPPSSTVSKDHTLRPAETTTPAAACRDGGANNDYAAALAMLDLFASVGATRFDVTWTNSANKPRRPLSLRKKLQALGGGMPQPENDDWLNSVYIAGLGLADFRRTAGAMLDTASADRLNLIIRPEGSGVWFIQLDDLTAGTLASLPRAMFLIIETSPGSFQAWLAMPGDHDKEFARRVRRAARTDLSATGATRIAGSCNFKDKYAPHFPRVKIREAFPGRMTSAAELDRLGLVAPPGEFVPVSPALPFTSGSRLWPSYAKALEGAPMNRKGTGPDRSRADYWWCFLAIAWGHSIDATAERLMEESVKAREYGKSYAEHTASHAASAVERRRQPPRRSG